MLPKGGPGALGSPKASPALPQRPSGMLWGRLWAPSGALLAPFGGSRFRFLGYPFSRPFRASPRERPKRLPGTPWEAQTSIFELPLKPFACFPKATRGYFFGARGVLRSPKASRRGAQKVRSRIFLGSPFRVGPRFRCFFRARGWSRKHIEKKCFGPRL